MPTCREIACHVSAAQDRPLRFWERLTIGLHLIFCRGCRWYARDLEAIRRAIYNGRAIPSDTLSPEARAAIRASLKGEDVD
ncbi:MAG: anti-sigma factor family protein [Acidiferrobacter sp.]